MNPLPAIEARGLTKSFAGRQVVCGVDLDIPTGTCFGLLGPNGAGKTTTIRMLLGLSPFDCGSLRVFGQSLPEYARETRRRVGVVPQADNLDPDFTVRENLMVYASYFGIARESIQDRMDYLLDFASLSDRANSRIDTLSGGMKRRLTIARSLVNDPEMLVLDEPTTGLDPQVRHLIWSRMRDLKKLGKTLLLTTHYMEEAQRLCDQLVIVDQGEILAQGTPRELITRHVEPEVLELHGNLGKITDLMTDMNVRTETVGDTVYCYTANTVPVIDRFKQHHDLSLMQRPANLEDVFLRITGRELRD